MLSLRKPGQEEVRALIERQRDLGTTYAPVGLTAGSPAGRRRRREVRLGPAEAFEAAREAVRAWRQYDLPWTIVAEPKPPIVVGEVVAVVAWTFGMWSVNVSRIVYVEEGPDRFAYAIGTLPHHLETGEERFEVRRDVGGTFFTISSESGPHHPLVRLGWPAAEWTIRRFLRQGGAAMRRAVGP